MSREEIRDRIHSIKWRDYEAPCGDTEPMICTQLLELFSEHQEAAMEASSALWNNLCHQAQTVSAALPAYEILLAGVRILNDDLKVEVMDILYNIIGGIPEIGGMPSWKSELRKKFERDRSFYEELADNSNEDIAAFAELILEQISR